MPGCRKRFGTTFGTASTRLVSQTFVCLCAHSNHWTQKETLRTKEYTHVKRLCLTKLPISRQRRPNRLTEARILRGSCSKGRQKKILIVAADDALFSTRCVLEQACGMIPKDSQYITVENTSDTMCRCILSAKPGNGTTAQRQHRTASALVPWRGGQTVDMFGVINGTDGG